MTSVTPDTAMSTDAMRAEADQINAAVREDNRALWERSRRAAQLAFEADLIDAAELAEAAWQGTVSRLSRLEAEVGPLVTAEREAGDRLRSDRKRLARRSAELDRARKDSAPAARREDLAVRVHELGQAVAASEEAAAKARRNREQKEAEVTSWEAEVSSCYADYAEAARRAQSPGAAPGMPAIAPGVGRISDLDKETRDLIGTVVLLAGAAGLSGNSPAAPDAGAAMKDQSRFRMVKNSRGQGLIIPPRMP